MIDEGERDDLQAQIDDLIPRMVAGEAEIAGLSTRADDMEARSLIDRDMIADLHRDGVLRQQQVEELEEALRSSRTIGTAIGILMASRHLDQEEAFAVLKVASQNSNRKLRELAAELVVSARALDGTTTSRTSSSPGSGPDSDS